MDETYLEEHLQPWSGLNLVQKLRLRVNWQQGGDLPGGRVVSRADYTWHWGRLQAGMEGLWPYRFKDRATDGNSFERHTQFVTLINRLKYFGYQLYTTVGFNRNREEFDDPFRQVNNVND